jgi:methionine-rich copper-binding protein CopC
MFNRRFVPRSIAGSIAAFALVLAAVPAFAHSHPVSMTPAKDAVTGAPTEISIVFSEDLEPKFSTLAVEDSTGVIVSKQKAVLDPANAKHLTLALPKLAAGVYTVDWVSSSADGHTLKGKYSFTVK